jgi:hypothetical protein
VFRVREAADGQDPKAYIEALLDTHSKYSDVVNGPFKAELGFNASLDKVSCPPTDSSLMECGSGPS